MKILYISNNQTVYETLKARFEPMGYMFSFFDNVHEALGSIRPGLYDCIFMDPMLAQDARMMVINMRRNLNNMPFVLLMGERELNAQECFKIGGNQYLPLNASVKDFDLVMENAQRIKNLIKRFADESEDFPSAGGVIAKSAFHQIFMASIDLPGRNYQPNYLLFIRIDNPEDITAIDGPNGLDYTIASLSKFLVQFRRQSDIVGRTAQNEYSILLQGLSRYEDALAAAARFQKALLEAKPLLFSGVQTPNVSLSLMAVPSGMRTPEEGISSKTS